MTKFKLLREQQIDEINGNANLYKHKQTGAEILSINNNDENKLFGITFRTPPNDSTGVAHILEHSVLCGSRKYPLKDPFVQLLKGSLQTFLNAMTFPDKTCYPVASCNLQDFYNLVDVYLDSVFYPRITPDFFKQEGWHYETDPQTGKLIYKGVVYNEMKGAYSSADDLLAERSIQSLFPDNTYGYDSGGNPRCIPELTYEQFKDFHRKYYHPSNARIFFYGNDNPEQRLKILSAYLDKYERLAVDSSIPIQKDFSHPIHLKETFDASEDEKKGMLTINWRLPETVDTDLNFALQALNHILIGTAASPLRKALIESGLGEDLTGGGLESQLRQMVFSIGLKGVATSQFGKVEELIMQTLEDLAKQGIHPSDIEASLNTLEFSLRENNTGSYPRGLNLMLKSLATWLYERDPLGPIAFEKPLKELKQKARSKARFFEELIQSHFLSNQQRSHLILEPDPERGSRLQREEEQQLEAVRKNMSEKELADLEKEKKKLLNLQSTPDTAEDLAKIPQLKRRDIDPEIKTVPRRVISSQDSKIIYHDIFTNGILYLDLGFDVHKLPQKHLAWLPLFLDALLKMGTQDEDYISLTRHIAQKTGGISPALLAGQEPERKRANAYAFLRTKCIPSQAKALLEILQDILLKAKFDQPERFKQILREQKAHTEAGLIPAGHSAVSARLKARYSEAEYLSAETSGIRALLFQRNLLQKAEDNWGEVLAELRSIRETLIQKDALLINLTASQEDFQEMRPILDKFLATLPAPGQKSDAQNQEWDLPKLPRREGITLPSQVNYVGSACDLKAHGYRFNGSALAVVQHLRTGYLWEKIRVQGGAYGAVCGLNPRSGIFQLVSYRDPNIKKTLQTYRELASYLRNLSVDERELEKAVVGTIGKMDHYKLPDARGFADLQRWLAGYSDEERQGYRDKLLNATSSSDFHAFGEVLERSLQDSATLVLGSADAIAKARGVEFESILKLL